MKHGLLVFATLATLAPTALAQDAQKAIQAQYDKRSAAALKRDIAGALAINAPEFISVGTQGQKQTLAQIKPLLVQAFAKSKSYAVVSKITRCQVSGDKATVSVTDTVKILATNGTIPQELEAVSEDSWVKKSGQWLRTQSKRLSEKRKALPATKPSSAARPSPTPKPK